MSGSDRGKGLAPLEAFFCIVALLGVVWIGYATGRTFGVDVGRNEVTAREHYERVKANALQPCVGIVGSAALNCAAKAVETAQERSESRQDLYAQQDMARWAFWMLAVTIATLGVTATGVWLVKRTLEATLEAVEDTGKATKAMEAQNAIAKDTAERQLRAYISVESLVVENVEVGVVPNGVVNIINSGQTPAERLSLAAYLGYAYVANPEPIFEIIDTNPLTCTVGPQRPYTAYPDAPAVWTEAHAAEFAAGTFGIYIFGEVQYFDVFGKERFTRFRALFDKNCRPSFTKTCAAGNDST